MKIEIRKFLSDQTEAIFQEIDQFGFIQNFALVGGSGLSYYLNHRLSEDLDYSSWESTLNKNEIDKFLRSINKAHNLTILNQSPSEIDLLIDNIKITFFANDWLELKKNRQKILKNTFVASIELLTAMKINVLSARAKFRDYYDLYVLAKERYNIDQIYDISKNKIPGLTKKILAMQISYIEDIDDEGIKHLNPKYNVTLPEIHKYFEEQVSAFIKVK